MNHEIEACVGNNLRTLRLRAGLTQDEVAAKLQVLGCDVTRSAIAKIEVGQRHVYVDELIALQKVLFTTFDEMLNITPESSIH